MTGFDNIRTLHVNKNDSGQRLDKFLTKTLVNIPKSLLYKYFRLKSFKVNGKRADAETVLCEGDEIQLFIRDEFFDSPEQDLGAIARIEPKLDVVYEDENIILMNKRPGVLVHEDDEGRDNTLLMHLQSYLYRKGEYDARAEQSFAPALCNRIDRNTGGIVIAAKNAAALRDMNYRIKSGQVSKFYLCAVHGIPAKRSDTLKGFLFKDLLKDKKQLISIIVIKHKMERTVSRKHKTVNHAHIICMYAYHNSTSSLKVRYLSLDHKPDGCRVGIH